MELAEPWTNIGGAQLVQGRREEARQSFERAAALDPEGADPLIAFGLLAEEAGEPDEAARWYARAQAVPVPSSEAYWRAAGLAIEEGRLDQAREFLAHVPQADLRLPLAARRLATAERKAGRVELARTRVEGALREYPWDIPLWMLKAELLDQAGELKGALAARREALALAPDRVGTRNAVAWTLARLGHDLDEAERHVEAAIASLGRMPPLLDTYATVRVAEGRYADALELADEGLEGAGGGTRVDLLFRRAEALAGLGRRAEAERSLDEALGATAGSDATSSSWEESERRVRSILAAGA
jgi:tetratricopeptide (TPR) repeat protein